MAAVTCMMPCAPQSAASDQYFQALRFELQAALVEGQVLVSREDVLLL